jgi:hypothetical protein
MLVRQTQVWDDAWSKEIIVYPVQQGDPTHEGMPADVRAAMREAYATLNAGAFSASALMCRKSLEMLCAQHGIKTGNLATSLQQMKERGHIDGPLFEWADALRIAGNEAAHEPSPFSSPQDARDLIEFTRALVDYTVTVGDRFLQFKQRKAGRTGLPEGLQQPGEAGIAPTGGGDP